MAYNNGFPVGYQPAQFYYPQQNQYFNPQQNMQSQTPNNIMPNQPQSMTPPTIHAEIIQVDNEQAAADFPLAAGSSQMMIARDDSAIYVKTMYANGQYNLDAFVKRPNAPKKREIDPDIYVTREELESRLKELLDAYRDTSKPQAAKAVKSQPKKEGEE